MNYTVIDVREPEEFIEGHVNGAINLPPSVLMKGATQELSEIAKDTPILVYCRTGSRSNVAMQILEAMGYTNITNGINKDQVKAKYGL